MTDTDKATDTTVAAPTATAEKKPRKKKEKRTIAQRNAAILRQAQNLAWDAAKDALSKRPDLREIAEGIAVLRKYDREAALYDENEAEMLDRLARRIERVKARAIVARNYRGGSCDGIGAIEAAFVALGNAILPSLDKGTMPDDAALDAIITEHLPSHKRTDILALVESDPFAAFRRPSSEEANEDAIPPEEDSDEDFDEDSDDSDAE